MIASRIEEEKRRVSIVDIQVASTALELGTANGLTERGSRAATGPGGMLGSINCD